MKKGISGRLNNVRLNNYRLNGPGGSGNATADDLPLGKTASVDTGDIIGTGANVKRFKSGTVTSESDATLFIDETGATVNGPYYRVTVSESFGFTPSRIVIIPTTLKQYGDATFYLESYLKYVSASDYAQIGNNSHSVFLRLADAATVSDAGFEMPVGIADTSYDWLAVE